MAKAGHIEEVKDIAQEFRERFGALPQPVENLLYILGIEILAMGAKVISVSTQGKQIVMKALEIVVASEAKQSLGESHDGTVKIGATQIRHQASGG